MTHQVWRTRRAPSSLTLLTLAFATLTLVASAAPGALACSYDFHELAPLPLPPPLPESRMTLGDFDRDGRDDAAVTHPGCPGSVHLARATATGFVSHQVLGPGDGLSASPSGVALADLDLDGDLDLAVAHLEDTGCGDRGVTVFFQRADGTFGDAASWSGDGDGRRLIAADLEGTGLPLLVTGDGPPSLNATTGKAVQVRENEGPGDFSHVHEYGLQPTGGGVTSLLSAGRLDLDDELDLMIVWGDRRELVTLCNFGDDTFTRASESVFTGAVGAVGAMAAADVNDDDRLDLVIADATSPSLSILSTTATGGSDECPAPSAPQPCTSVPNIENLLVEDLDLDGHPEIVGLVPSRGVLAMHGGTSVGTFGPAREQEIGGTPVLGAFGALAEDEHADLALLDADGRLRLLVNRSGLDRCPIARTTGFTNARTTTGCEAEVTLDGTPSTDLDGDPLTYLWFESGDLLLETTEPMDVATLGLGLHHLVLIVRDPAGHESRPAGVSVRVTDGTRPVLDASGPVERECDDPRGAFVRVSATATDACGEPIITSSFANDPFVERWFPVGSTSVRWRARDESGNSDEATTGITVTDTVAPALGCPSEVLANCTGGEPVEVSLVAGVSDTCTEAADIVVENDRGCGGLDASGTYPPGETLVTFTARDGAGNESTCQTRVMVIDAEPPAIQAPPRRRVECQGDAQAVVGLVATASDECSDAAVSSDRGPGGDASGSYPLGVSSVAWRAIDTAGNESSATTEVEVIDSMSPDLACSSEIRVECTSPAGAEVEVVANAFDRCDPAPVLANDRTSAGGDASGLYPVGTTTVRFEATDQSGNGASCATRVIVEDAEAPTLRCPARIEAECDGTGTANVSVRAEGIDCCDDTLLAENDRTGSGLDASGEYPLGETLVRFTATDDAGHATTCETLVVVRDTRAPALGCPAEVRAECAGPAGTPVSLAAFASDACDPAVMLSNDRTGAGGDASDLYPLGRTRVRFDAVDDAGHAASCVSEVLVQDTLPPLVVGETDDDCLWPPNHRMVRFRLGEHLRVTALDQCAGEGDLTLEVLGVESNEPVDGRGDGSTEPDVIVDGDELLLRAERRGGAPGRIYTVRLGVTDPSGNAAVAELEIRVPHGGNAPEGCKPLPPDRFVR